MSVIPLQMDGLHCTGNGFEVFPVLFLFVLFCRTHLVFFTLVFLTNQAVVRLVKRRVISRELLAGAEVTGDREGGGGGGVGGL